MTMSLCLFNNHVFFYLLFGDRRYPFSIYMGRLDGVLERFFERTQKQGPMSFL